MDKIVSQLVNKELTLEEKVKADLEKKFKTLDIDLILANPEGELTDFGLSLIDDVFIKYAMSSTLIGVEFADAVKKKKEPLELVNGSD